MSGGPISRIQRRAPGSSSPEGGLFDILERMLDGGVALDPVLRAWAAEGLPLRGKVLRVCVEHVGQR